MHPTHWVCFFVLCRIHRFSAPTCVGLTDPQLPLGYPKQKLETHTITSMRELYRYGLSIVAWNVRNIIFDKCRHIINILQATSFGHRSGTHCKPLILAIVAVSRPELGQLCCTHCFWCTPNMPTICTRSGSWFRLMRCLKHIESMLEMVSPWLPRCQKPPARWLQSW